MNAITEKETGWVKKHLVPKITEVLGKKCKNVRSCISFPENCFFVSCVYFLDLTFDKTSDDGEGPEGTLKLVVKKAPLNIVFAQQAKMTRHFHNEILFYKNFTAKDSRFPRCVYTNEGDLEDCVIVIENISVQGYELYPKSEHYVPTEYIYSAVSEIGILHAMAYVMKEREPEKFFNIANDIQDPRFKDSEWMPGYVNALATRPIDWLRCDYEKEMCDKLERHLSNAYEEIMLYAIKPTEPLATLCHGDFTRNNIFFRKNNDRIEAKLFDFALISYSSPAIDLSTFLYLNCSAKDRVQNFDKIYRCYHDALKNYLRQSGISNLEKYSYDKMIADYRRRAAFGYTIVCFFLPIDRGYMNLDFEHFFDNPMAGVDTVRRAGGEAVTKLFAEMILELKNLGSFDHVL